MSSPIAQDNQKATEIAKDACGAFASAYLLVRATSLIATALADQREAAAVKCDEKAAYLRRLIAAASPSATTTGLNFAAEYVEECAAAIRGTHDEG